MRKRLKLGIEASDYLKGISYLIMCLKGLSKNPNIPDPDKNAFTVSLIALMRAFIDTYAHANSEPLDNIFQVLLDGNQYIRGVPKSFHDDIMLWELLKQFFSSRMLFEAFEKTYRSKPQCEKKREGDPLVEHDTDTLIIQVLIKGDHLELRTAPKKTGLDLWGAAIAVARAAIRLEERTINDFVEDLFNPDI